ncbi:unnamed protein product, partial [Ectocarpus sp. 12 AP-2014]
MRECEEQRQYPRSAALAVFHGDLRAAVSALRRAHDVTNRELQAALDVAALMPPAGPAAAASHTQVADARRSMCVLLDMMSMCIAGFNPPPARRSKVGGAGQQQQQQQQQLHGDEAGYG